MLKESVSATPGLYFPVLVFPHYLALTLKFRGPVCLTRARNEIDGGLEVSPEDPDLPSRPAPDLQPRTA